MFRYPFMLLILVSLLVLVGCNQELRPDGMPAIYPCVILVTQEGTPLADAGVSFAPLDASMNFSGSGTTDASGKAKIFTYGFEGSPAGKFKVTVGKTIYEGGKESINPSSGAKTMVGQKIYSYVENQYTSFDSSPLEIEVKTGKNSATFEVGKAVKDFLGDSLN